MNRQSTPPSPLFDRLVATVLLAGLAATSLLVSFTGKEVFRFPKAIALEGEGILLIAILLIGLLFGRLSLRPLRWRDPAIVLLEVVLGWSCVVTLTSSRPAISIDSFQLILAWAIVIIALLLVASPTEEEPGAVLGRLRVLWFVFALGIGNGVILLLQILDLRPLPLDEQFIEHHLGVTGLIGNPNETGSFLVFPTLAAVVLIFVARNRARTFAIAAATMLFASLLLTQTRTALAACLAGIAALTIFLPWKKALLILGTPVLALAAILAANPAFLHSSGLIRSLQRGDYDQVISGRLIAFASAVEMIEQRPWTGFGPGTFPAHYFDAKIRAEKKYPSLSRSGNASQSFGEAHNDHLELMAEGGIPAYLLFLAALAVIASGSLRRRANETPEQKFARMFSLPLATSIFVLTLAQFPLQIVSQTSMILFLAALTRAWGAR